MKVGDPVRIRRGQGPGRRQRLVRGVVLGFEDGLVRVSTDRWPIFVIPEQLQVIRKRDERVAVLSRRAAIDTLAEGLRQRKMRRRAG